MTRDEADSNSPSRLVWWLLGIVTTVVISLVGAWGGKVNTQVNTNTVNIATTITSLVYIKETLDRIEAKVDALATEKKR